MYRPSGETAIHGARLSIVATSRSVPVASARARKTIPARGAPPPGCECRGSRRERRLCCRLDVVDRDGWLLTAGGREVVEEDLARRAPREWQHTALIDER